ncbi:condensin-2 complex subunit D3 isoform X2 [Osmerus eperlanus]|uniref:condensin-2 complex subunit D3 isoform X2 n=1 Tax=Osmerus eperlanus TaxID=29151 RepID=UPI002E0D49C9
MELMNALEILKLSNLSKDWVDGVWDLEFTEVEALDAAIEDSITRNGSQGLEALYRCLLPYTNNAESSTAASDGLSQSVWTVLGDSGVSTRSLVALLAYFVVGARTRPDGFQPRLLSLHAASIYLLLLGTPGSVVNQVFQQVLFDACLALPAHCWPQSCGRKRKKECVKSSQAEGKRPRGQRREQEEVEVGEVGEVGEERIHFSPRDLLTIREAIVLLVRNLLRLLQTFPLKDKPQSADSCVQIFTELTDFEPVIGELEFNSKQALDEIKSVPELAYYGLALLCSPSHGDEKENVRRVFHSLLYVILMMRRGEGCKPTLLLPSQAVISSRDQALLFVCHLVGELKETALPFLRILLQHLCCQMVEKTDYRSHGAQAVSQLLDKMPGSDYASFIKWLFGYSTHSKVAYRLFALDVSVALLACPERQAEDSLGPEQAGLLSHRFLVQSLVFGRRSDASPTVRAHALTCLSRCLEMPSLNATRCVQELFSSTGVHTVLEGDGTDGSLRSQKTFRTLQFKTVDITGSDISYESKEAMSLLMRRVGDQKTIVRKSALQAIMSLMKHSVILLGQESLSVLSERCRDPALSVKKKAMQCLGELLHAHSHSRVVQRAWLRGLLPAIMDPESSVQDKALESLEQVVLSQVKKHSPSSWEDAGQKLCWDLLGLLCDDCQDLSRYFSKAFTVWSKQNKFTAAFITNLVSHMEAEHAAGAWLLLSRVAGSSPKLDYSKILDAWDRMVRLRNVTVTTSCHILSVLGDVCEHLNEDTRSRIVEDIMSLLRSLEMPLEVVGASVEALCRLGRAQAMRDTQYLNQHCGELVSLCETYLSTVILNEKGAQNLNEDLVVKHLYLLGVVSLHCPARVGKRTVLLVESVLSSSPEHTAGGQPEEPPASQPPASQPPASQPPASQPLFSQPLSQFHPSTLPSRVRAHAVLTLGKLCLQHEDLTQRYLPAFARELQLSADMAVRSNVALVMCDLCVRYTNMLERYLPNISACLQDNHPLVREQTVTMLTSLLQEEFVKWKGSLFFRFVTVLVDPEPAVSRLCEYCLVHLLLKKNPAMFSQHFIECIFHFNSYEKHKTYNKFSQTAREKARFSLRGSQNKDKRFRIYRFLLENFTDAQRFNITTKISHTVLACFVDGELALDAEGREVLSETLGVLSLKEMKLQALAAGRGEVDEQDDEQVALAKAVVQVAQKKVVSQVQKKVFIENMIPIIIALKSKLEQQRSPVLKDLMGYLQVTMQDYRSEVKELFAADEQLAAELEYNLKLYEKEQQDNMAASSLPRETQTRDSAASSLASPSRRLIQGAITTPRGPLPAQLSRLLSQSARRPPLRAADQQTSGPHRRLSAQESVSVPPKGSQCYRAFSTPHGNINDVTFGEGLSAIFSERRGGSSDREEESVLHLRSPEQRSPALRQWEVQSPLANRTKKVQ